MSPVNKLHESELIELGKLGELAEGTSRGFCPVNGVDTVFAVRKGGSVRAYVNKCPHQGASLNYRKDYFLSADGTTIMCYAHGARFDIDTGECVGGPCPGAFLQRVPVFVEGDAFHIPLRFCGQKPATTGE